MNGAGPRDYNDPSLYLNRELSWLAFNRRVLEEAQDSRNPLLERVKFLAIFSSNLDEFYMIRVTGLLTQAEAGAVSIDPGLTPREQLAAIQAVALELSTAQAQLWADELVPALAREQIRLRRFHDLAPEQQAVLTERFRREIAPVLTPQAVDPHHPFPHISNLSLNLLVVLAEEHGDLYARVKVPAVLPRLVAVPTLEGPTPPGRHHEQGFVWLEDVVAAHLDALFPGMTIGASYPFHVTRNADLDIQEDEASDLLVTVQASLRRRGFGSVTRLCVDATMPAELRDWLAERLRVRPEGLFTVDGPLRTADLMELTGLDRPDLKYTPFVPRVPAVLRGNDGDLFSLLRHQDILLHHPYESFDPVAGFVQAAASDHDVLAIKQTLYRVGRDSPVVEALARARDDDTQVAVLVELKARFDEENNIEWARALEAEGVHVVYGVASLKTHAKVALIVRRERDGVRRYVHLGTGNYNATTARIYTDLSMLTASEALADDVSELFNALTGYAPGARYQRLLVAPEHLRPRLLALIERECTQARAGEEARLIFKMNALTDSEMIAALYRASGEGVQIDLIVRGICRLRPGIPGISERIRVLSIVGRYLEHSRVFYFRNGGADEVYLGSADLMERNLNRRVEVVFPVEDPALIARLRDEILAAQLRDTAKARELQADGSYVRVRPAEGEEPFDSQVWFMER